MFTERKLMNRLLQKETFSFIIILNKVIFKNQQMRNDRDTAASLCRVSKLFCRMPKKTWFSITLNLYLLVLGAGAVELHHECHRIDHNKKEDYVFKLLWRHEPPRFILDTSFWNVPEIGIELNFPTNFFELYFFFVTLR